MNKLCFIALIITTFTGSLPANAAYPPPSGAYDLVQGINQPAIILRNKLLRAQNFMRNSSASDPATVLRFLQDEVAQIFEFERMAQWIGGAYYRRMDIEGRVKFQNRLKENILSAISRHIGIFNHQKLKMDFYQPRRIGRGKVSAAIRIQHPAQRPIRLVFKFHLGHRGEWKVYDVAIDGLSAISYYRDYYRKAVNQYGTRALIR